MHPIPATNDVLYAACVMARNGKTTNLANDEDRVVMSQKDVHFKLAVVLANASSAFRHSCIDRLL